MQLVDQKNRSNQEGLEPGLYAALVDSMCQNFWPMFIGSVSGRAAALMTALKTGNILLWPCALLLVAIGTARAFQMRRYESRASTLTFEQAKDLEPRYRAGAVLQAGALGLWCFLTILLTDDPVAHMLCVAVTVGYTAGGAARNCGRPMIVQLHILCACGPMSLALALHGGFYYIGLAVLLVLFFVGLKHNNLSLHAIFVKALTSSFRESALAGQFDTALNNMPHGLCMFRADGRLAVMNCRFSEMMKLSDDLVQRGASASDIVADCVSAGSISAASGNMILSEIENAQARDIITTDPDAARDRSLSWAFQPMAGGGAVVLLEDITERRHAEARITHLARYDALTALPNRVNFRDEIERLLALPHRATQLSALLFIDLDQFKQVNDTLGHPCGDQLLCTVADRLREMLRPEDFVARFGGDEFVVFQQNIHSHEDAAGLARRIVDRLSERYKIDNLGRWILRKACMECMKWPEAVSVAVNFSPQQFHQRDVLSEVRYALEVSGLPAHRLEIEITESSLLRNTQVTHDVLSQLHSLGGRISLDDFGTGYSSLRYLQHFPLQKVKIDRSFLEGIDSDRPLTLLRGVARLSADLGMSVVVEGIETNEQLELISADGTVTEAQGYLFSRPVPAVRVRQLLNASHGRRVPEEQIPSRSIA